ncbi:MAG: DUF3552 domain-containing protein, partial [Bacteroidales bacterium]
MAAAFVVGGFLSYVIWQKALRNKSEAIIKEAETEAEVIRKDKILQAKEKFLQLKADHEKIINEKNSRLAVAESKFRQRETALSQRMEENQRARKEVEAIRENLNVQIGLVEKKNEELSKLHKQQVEQLEAISALSGDEAKAQLIESLKEEAKTEAMSYVNEIMDEAKMTGSKEAKRIVVQTIQRVATENAIENSVTVFHIDTD